MTTTLTREQIIERLCRLAAAEAGVNVAEVSADTDFFADLNFDSLDIIEYVMTLEDEFQVSIPDEKAQTVKTVAQAADVLIETMSS
ncbi:MAG: acyl carrier protein [Planctomycetes bacterium]|nr:acyl carrier protein [Planctomycetota bacterium]